MIIRLNYSDLPRGDEIEAFWHNLETTFGASQPAHTDIDKEKRYVHEEYEWRIYDIPGLPHDEEFIFNTMDVTPKTPAAELWCQLNAPAHAVFLEDPTTLTP